MIPRVRVFAGPNGSGKSTIKKALPRALLGVYINPDELEIELKGTGRLDLSKRGIPITDDFVSSFFSRSNQAQKHYTDSELAGISLRDGSIHFLGLETTPYLASIASDLLRQALLIARKPFSFETVMSHKSKIDFLAQAQESEFCTYLYYVATEDVEINISRVQIESIKAVITLRKRKYVSAISVLWHCY